MPFLLLFQTLQLMILQGRRQLNPPRPVGSEFSFKSDQEARLSFESEQDEQVKLEYNTAILLPAGSVPPDPRPKSLAFTSRRPGSSVNKKARDKPALPFTNHCDRSHENKKCIFSDSLPLASAPNLENATVHWKGINSSISSSPGFQIWAQKFAVLTGETKSRAELSQIPSMQQERKKAHTARASSVAVPRFLESAQIKN